MLPDSHVPPLALAGFLPVWDIERRSADLSPIIRWTVEQIRGLGHPIESLETLHHHLDAPAAIAVAQSLTAASLAHKLRHSIAAVTRAILPEIPFEQVFIQTHAHFRILVPGDRAAPVPPHTDFGFGHSLAERNLWFGLTAAQDGAALHVLPLRDSLFWLARAQEPLGVVAGAPEIPPVPTRAGDILLFTPLHLHRARTPPAGCSRVSIDLRIRPRPAAVTDYSFSALPRSS